MPRGEFKTIVAPEPVVSKVEEYRQAKGLPSKSQALAKMTEEIERKQHLLNVLKVLLEKISKALKDIKGASGKRYQAVIEQMATMMQTIFEEMLVQLNKP